tara:strand:+ start:8247 stop:9068 length:822 start_codon:yes stop_codon:yes gene_type:complete
MIDVIVACGRNSLPYVQLMVNTIELTADFDTKFRFLLGINDTPEYIPMAKQIKSKYKIEVFDCISPGEFSMGHGEALDLLMEHVDAEHCLVTDCDIVYLNQHWEKLMLEKIKGNIAIVGSQYDPNRKGEPKKYQNFPNVVTSIFKTQIIKDCNISFKPEENAKRIIDINSENQHVYGNDPGMKLDLDTGWQLCHNLKTNGYDGIPMPLRRKSAGQECQFLEEGTRGEEHWLDEMVLSSHAGRSYSRDLYSHPKALGWLENVNNWFANMKHIRE